MKKRRWLVLLAVAAVLVGTVCFAAGCKKKDIEGLYKPTNITYDGARITWDKVALAEHYTVQINDSLWKIAQKYLGSGLRWKEIYEANRDSIRTSNFIQVGQVLVLPAR